MRRLIQHLGNVTSHWSIPMLGCLSYHVMSTVLYSCKQMHSLGWAGYTCGYGTEACLLRPQFSPLSGQNKRGLIFWTLFIHQLIS